MTTSNEGFHLVASEALPGMWFLHGFFYDPLPEDLIAWFIARDHPLKDKTISAMGTNGNGCFVDIADPLTTDEAMEIRLVWGGRLYKAQQE